MEIETSLRALFATFGTEATPDLIRGYWFGLSDLEAGVVAVAVSRAIRECDRLPRPAKLRELSGIGSHETRALQAWSDVLPNVSRLGYRRHVDFEDRLINATIRNMSGTWDAFCDRCNTDDVKWIKQDFVKTYAAFATSGVDGEVCRALPGGSEVEIDADGKIGPPCSVIVQCTPERRGLPLVKTTSLEMGELMPLPIARIKSVS